MSNIFIKKLAIHAFILLSIILIYVPLYFALIAASHEGNALNHSPLPIFFGSYFFENIKNVLFNGIAATNNIPLWKLLLNSFCMASLIAIGKVFLAITSAYALVYFDFAYKKLIYWVIFSTMILPVEIRIIPTFQITATLGLVNSYMGLTLPLIASATATFLFRQFFNTIPRELLDAAKIDGANAIKFFWDIVLPCAKPQIIALIIIMFVYGWNQYLWPLIITTDANMATIVMGIRKLSVVADQVPQWHLIMSIAIIALLPPCGLILLFQKWLQPGINQ